MSITVSVIIVNFNGRHLLAECLGSLREQTLKETEVILVDNGSTDGSVGVVRELFPEVRIVEKCENLGYGGGNNAGIMISNGRYVALLNNDTRVDAWWLEKLVAAAEQDRSVGMCASKIMNYYEPGIFDNTGLLMYRDGIARGRGRLEKDTGQYGVSDEVFFPSGCACLYRREMLDEIGLFDEDLFLYLDDVDIGLRARLAGWRCVYAPDAVVYHKYSATVEPYSPLKAFLVERNRIWIVIKYFPLVMLLASPFFTLWRYAVQAYGVLRGRGAGSRLVRSHSGVATLKILLRAYFSGLRGSATMMRKRFRIMKMKKAANREIYGWFRRFGISAGELALKD